MSTRPARLADAQRAALGAALTGALRGEVRFDNAQIDDQILLKTDGFPTYHLANVVDDHLMQITEGDLIDIHILTLGTLAGGSKKSGFDGV